MFVQVINAVCGSPIPVPWLTNTASIDEVLFAGFDRDFVAHGWRRVRVPNKGALNVGMAKEAESSLLISKTGRCLSRSEDITPVSGHIEGSVDDGEIVHLLLQGQMVQPRPIRFTQLGARPHDRLLRHFIEID